MKRKPLNDALRRMDNNHDRINWGGCAVVAYLLAKELAGHLRDMRITTNNHDGIMHDIDEVRNNVQDNHPDEWRGNGVGFYHVWIEGTIGSSSVCIDSEGVHEAEYFHEQWGTPAKGSFTITEVEEMASMPNEWNSMFDRSQIPSIENTITTDIRSAICS